MIGSLIVDLRSGSANNNLRGNSQLAAQCTAHLSTWTPLQKSATPSRLERVAQRTESQVNQRGARYPDGADLANLSRAGGFAQHGATGRP
jgi:hypothetical protein